MSAFYPIKTAFLPQSIHPLNICLIEIIERMCYRNNRTAFLNSRNHPGNIGKWRGKRNFIHAFHKLPKGISIRDKSPLQKVFPQSSARDMGISLRINHFGRAIRVQQFEPMRISKIIPEGLHTFCKCLPCLPLPIMKHINETCKLVQRLLPESITQQIYDTTCRCAYPKFRSRYSPDLRITRRKTENIMY